MRVLFASNFFPPATVGGYEMWCHDIAEELARRGHHVSVVTARSPESKSMRSGVNVHRILDLEVVGGFTQTLARLKARRPRERRMVAALRELVGAVQPDVALIWGMWNVPRLVPATIEELLPARTAYYLCDYWPTLPSAFLQQLEADSRRSLARLFKKAVAAPLVKRLRGEPVWALRFEVPICCSHAVQRSLAEAGVPVAHGQVVPGGVKTEEFACTPRAESNGECLNLLYLGRIAPEKGVHTALRAIHACGGASVPVTLDIVGAGDAQYQRELHQYLRTTGIGDRVRFVGPVPSEDIPRILSRYGALVFCSEWEEPFARTVLEAMAAGLPVIGTTTGGTGEVLVADQTGLTFPAGDHQALASQIHVLAGNPALGLRLAEGARKVVTEGFTFSRMADGLEEALASLARAPRDDASGARR